LPRQLGVGLIYWPALDPVFELGLDSVAVLELEPQALWEKVAPTGDWRHQVNEALLERVAAFPQPTLLHGVGQPLGGAVGDPVPHFPLLREAVQRLNPAWVSEHLSFNRVHGSGGPAETGFLLPPRQSRAGVRVAAANISAYRRELARPVAFETGVNYLQPGDDEMADGDFFGAVAELADCGILLDLHNLWCNELNGRARVLDVVEQLPLGRVWEMHLAGGMPLSGYWLDSHSDLVPPPLIEIAADVIARLPNLGAVNFEVLPEHLERMGLDAVHRQLDQLRSLWRLRPPGGYGAHDALKAAPIPAPQDSDVAEVRAWEEVLHTALTGGTEVGGEGAGAAADPGVVIYRGLIEDSRSGNLTRTMRYTVTALLAGLGSRDTRELLRAYAASCPPDSYPAVEAHHFATFLRGHFDVTRVRHLDEVLAFEHALVKASIFGSSTEVCWSVDPTLLLESLDAGRLPDRLPAVDSVMRVDASDVLVGS
jgi:uncharacterized protein (UPF0276 family)